MGAGQPNALSKRGTVRCARSQYAVLVLLLVAAEVTVASLTLAREDAINYVLHEMWHDASDEVRNDVQETVRGARWPRVHAHRTWPAPAHCARGPARALCGTTALSSSAAATWSRWTARARTASRTGPSGAPRPSTPSWTHRSFSLPSLPRCRYDGCTGGHMQTLMLPWPNPLTRPSRLASGPQLGSGVLAGLCARRVPSRRQREQQELEETWNRTVMGHVDDIY